MQTSIKSAGMPAPASSSAVPNGNTANPDPAHEPGSPKLDPNAPARWPAAVFFEIAVHASTVRDMLNMSIANDGDINTEVAAASLVGLIGYLADQGLDCAGESQLHGGVSEWLVSPNCQAALSAMDEPQ